MRERAADEPYAWAKYSVYYGPDTFFRFPGHAGATVPENGGEQVDVAGSNGNLPLFNFYCE
ncbi:hypothetical protein SK3146_00574 [Paenibacillus konkukensis]|uniref:Uncharacterized protein n=1 Tax=Paenibacillus konkukensis TaxID=2020716 RepID=A0ABY4RIR3_9BACL|nr:hypothetical protein SK3146_00574 [Paenibacillus konkukensis]